MKLSADEIHILQLLENGELDGDVGDTRVFRRFRSVLCRRFIKNGIPIILMEGKMPENVGDKEEECGELKQESIICDTTESKLLFLRKFGWLINNKEIQVYSARYKPGHEY